MEESHEGSSYDRKFIFDYLISDLEAVNNRIHFLYIFYYNKNNKICLKFF